MAIKANIVVKNWCNMKRNVTNDVLERSFE